MAGESNSPIQNSDDRLIHHEHTSSSPEANFTISQLATPETPNPSPNSNGVLSSVGKRRKSRPVRYGGSTFVVERSNSPSNFNSSVVDDSTRDCSSSKKQNSVNFSPALIRATQVQSSLGTEKPSCVKLMLRAHVDPGYWMGFPQWFGKSFLPKIECEMVLEDENDSIHLLRYNADKSGLSGGWKKFAAGHNLAEGDALVFHLVESYKFKVYIIRANDLNLVDGALDLLNLEAPPQQKNTPSSTKKKTKRRKSDPLNAAQKKHKTTTPSHISIHPREQSNDSEEVGSEVLEGSRPNKPEASFQELENFKDFHVMVNGVCIDSELTDDVRLDYYKLCVYKKELLHDSVSKNRNHKLVAGMIGETVNIANKIKNCKFTTSKEEFDAWDNSLKSFFQLDMKVEFLRDMILALSRLVFESEDRVDIEKYVESKNKLEQIEDEIKSVKEKLIELNEASRKLKGVVDGLKQKSRMHEAKFQELLDVPW
ncbi:B3 domain-containing protein Os01g0234100-like [Rutidosis leptorrhynchoides]|uniref:B3 domain-containing protein Os01g0234100-like n=1 Tax=Rutidosis leptorrhynchoides TaxID=125765 RepID=UPI003A992841